MLCVRHLRKELDGFLYLFVFGYINVRAVVPSLFILFFLSLGVAQPRQVGQKGQIFCRVWDIEKNNMGYVFKLFRLMSLLLLRKLSLKLLASCVFYVWCLPMLGCRIVLTEKRVVCVCVVCSRGFRTELHGV